MIFKLNDFQIRFFGFSLNNKELPFYFNDRFVQKIHIFINIILESQIIYIRFLAKSIMLNSLQKKTKQLKSGIVYR